MPNESAKIILAVTNGKLSKVRDSLAVEGTINALKVEFQFRTQDWDNTTKTAVFVRGRAAPSTTNADITYVILDENNECALPAEMLAQDGMFSVGVFGEYESYRIVSNWMCYKIANGCYADGSTPVDPESSAYNQLIKMIQSKSDKEHDHTELYYTKDESEDRFVSQEELPTPDWDSNDGEEGYIKNRPFYTEITTDNWDDMVVLENASFTAHTMDSVTMSDTFNGIYQYKIDKNGVTLYSGFIPLRADYGDYLLSSSQVSELGDGVFVFNNGSNEVVWNGSEAISNITITRLSGSITNTTIHKIDEKYLPKIQSDWNQNDESAVDHIKNRPFYEKYEDNLIIEGAITYDIAEMVATINNYENYVLNLNTKYIVTVNDISVECQFYPYSDGSQGYYFGDKEGKVYAVGYPPGTVGMHLSDIVFDNEYFNYYNVNFNDDRQKYCIGASISIVKRDCIIKQIDSKYLPNMQITPINEDGTMTNEEFTMLSDGIYYMYNSPLDNAFGLVSILNGYWSCYDTGYYYGDISLDDSGNIIASDEGTIDGFGYTEADYLLSNIVDDNELDTMLEEVLV